MGLSVVVESLPFPAHIVDLHGVVVAQNQKSVRRLDVLEALPIHTTLKPVADAGPETDEGFRIQILGKNGSTMDCHAVPMMDPARPDNRFLLMMEHLALEPSNAPSGEPTNQDRESVFQYDAGPVPTRALREEAAKFKRLSETDPLTGALNVRAFAARVTWALSAHPDRKGVLIFLDLNDFKEINDVFGHTAGDTVLAHVAKNLTYPERTGIATARLGGDEFAVWMPDVAYDNLAKVTSGIRDRLHVPVAVSGSHQVRVTAALGAACYPREAGSYESLKVLADKRMYADKALARPLFLPSGPGPI